MAEQNEEEYFVRSECIGCGGFIDPERTVVSRRGQALRYCTQECHDSYEAELDRREAHQEAVKAYRRWEDDLYAAAWDGVS